MTNSSMLTYISLLNYAFIGKDKIIKDFATKGHACS